MSEYGDNWDSNPANAKDCPACGGSGMLLVILCDDGAVSNTCPHCEGSGEVTPLTYRSIINDSREYEKEDCD